MKQKGFVLILLFLAIIAFAGATVFAGKNGLFSTPNASPPLVLNKAVDESCQTFDINKVDLTDGKVHLIKEDLGLVTTKSDNPEYYPNGLVHYYTAGEFKSGNYKGYKRIVAVREQTVPASPVHSIFATKDGREFILNGDPEVAANFPEDDYTNPLIEINKKCISKVDDLEYPYPQTLPLGDNLVLFRKGVYAEYKDTGKESNGYPIQQLVLMDDLLKLVNLSSPDKNFKFYYKPVGPSPLINLFPDQAKEFAKIQDQYLQAETVVIVVDSQGLAYSYIPTTRDNLKAYLTQQETYKQRLLDYGKKIKQYQAQNSQGEYPEYPQAVDLPHFKFENFEIKTSEKLFNEYNLAFPHACGTDVTTYVSKNIQDDELTKVGTAQGIDLFKLNNLNHPLIKAVYSQKVDSFDESTFKDINNQSKPTFEQYANKTPLLLFKDSWGRWVLVGEYDFKLMGGCGKPVLYFYPTKVTDISVQFKDKVELAVNIPKYKDGWKIKAYPDGKLVDLQPQFTSCDGIDNHQEGSEYAKEACIKNSYPYIYWSGQSTNQYPSASSGWIIKAEELTKFMSEKLEEIGLTAKEKGDMLEYWLPHIQKQNTPFYKISFLQTREMNSLVPMDIFPRPDSLYRIFLDFTPLQTRPEFEIAPQNLEKIHRNGFTVIEWGGLNK